MIIDLNKIGGKYCKMETGENKSCNLEKMSRL